MADRQATVVGANGEAGTVIIDDEKWFWAEIDPSNRFLKFCDYYAVIGSKSKTEIAYA